MLFKDLQLFDKSLTLIDGNVEQIDISTISSAIQPSPSSFIFIKNKRFLDSVGCLSSEDVFPEVGVVFEKSFYEKITKDEYQKFKFQWVATVDNVAYSMCVLSKPFYDQTYGQLNYHLDGRQIGTCEIDPNSEIAQNVFIGSHVKIGKGTVIMPGSVILPQVEIGENTTIFPNVTVYPYTKIGDGCRIHSSTVIGGDGFGYNHFSGEHLKIWHLAGVVIEDNVEIGGATMVDAGAFIATRVGSGTKLDNFCQISHNAQIGKNCILCGQAGASGSGEIDDYCVLGAGAGLAPGARIGKGSQLAARTIVSENSVWEPGSVLAGHPARPLKEWLKSQAKIRRLIKE